MNPSEDDKANLIAALLEVMPSTPPPAPTPVSLAIAAQAMYRNGFSPTQISRALPITRSRVYRLITIAEAGEVWLTRLGNGESAVRLDAELKAAGRGAFTRALSDARSSQR